MRRNFKGIRLSRGDWSPRWNDTKRGILEQTVAECIQKYRSLGIDGIWDGRPGCPDVVFMNENHRDGFLRKRVIEVKNEDGTTCYLTPSFVQERILDRGQKPDYTLMTSIPSERKAYELLTSANVKSIIIGPQLLEITPKNSLRVAKHLFYELYKNGDIDQLQWDQIRRDIEREEGKCLQTKTVHDIGLQRFRDEIPELEMPIQVFDGDLQDLMWIARLRQREDYREFGISEEPYLSCCSETQVASVLAFVKSLELKS